MSHSEIPEIPCIGNDCPICNFVDSIRWDIGEALFDLLPIYAGKECAPTADLCALEEINCYMHEGDIDYASANSIWK